MVNDAAHRLLIDGKTRSINELFFGAHYGIDFYQRDYAWRASNLQELLEDLTRSFLNQYQMAHSRSQVANYRPYFLGPIVTHATTELTYLVDGQQRLTTLSLLLLHLSTITADADQATELKKLVYSSKFGESFFTIDVEDRNPTMKKILNSEFIDTSNEDVSVKNIVARYHEIVEYFTDDVLRAETLVCFIDWLLHRVQLVEIQTIDRNMALEVFESMNDRGLQLTNMDMLKGYLLSKMNTAKQTEITSDRWKKTLAELVVLDKNADAEFMKTLLRSRYALTVRERNKGAVAKDFELIGSSFHKWFRDNAVALGFEHADDFEGFITSVMPKYANRYKKLIEVSQTFDPSWAYVYFNAHNNFTLQYLVILAAVAPGDDDEVFHAKADLIAKYLDLVIARRMVNYKIFGYSPMYFQMFNLAKELRDLPISEIQQILSTKVANLSEDFTAVESFRLNLGNRPNVKYLLGRLTSWLEGQDPTDVSKNDPQWAIYFARNLEDPFEVEHIWANHFKRHIDEFASESEFQDSRNSFGALLLLPKSVNASLSDMKVQEKIPHYLQQNALGRIISELGPEHDPNLRERLNRLRLRVPLALDELDPEQIKGRTRFYQAMCEKIWDPATLGLARLGSE
jgi:uncharacterized protein with ParB-like and HNH nuclease domain